MKLEERLAKRLRQWQQVAAERKRVIESLHPNDPERKKLQASLTRLELCTMELADDIAAASPPRPPVFPRRV